MPHNTPSNPDADKPSAEQFASIAVDRAFILSTRGHVDELVEAHFYNRTVDAERKRASEIGG